jgi:excisionase family DNA binding protein
MATAKRNLTDPRVQGRSAPDEDRLLTLEEVAERLQVGIAYVRRHLLHEYRLAYVKVGARTRRVRESDLNVFLATRRVTPDDYPVAQTLASARNASRAGSRR